MADLNGLLKDFFDNRLAYKQLYREKFEALLTGMVAEIEALKARGSMGFAMPSNPDDPPPPVSGTPILPAKRGPGRPPKEPADG